MRYHLIPIIYIYPGWLLSKKQNQNQKPSDDEGLEILKLLCTVGGNVKWYNQYRKEDSSSQKLKIELPYNPASPILDIYTQKNWRQGLKDLFVHLYS